MKYIGVLVLTFTVYYNLSAQQNCRLHIITAKDNGMMGFPFHFTVNGSPYKLKAGQCIELEIVADSVHVLMEDRRWVKNETVDLHTKTEQDLYVRVFWGWKENDRKRIRLFAESICKTCYDELKKKCKGA